MKKLIPLIMAVLFMAFVSITYATGSFMGYTWNNPDSTSQGLFFHEGRLIVTGEGPDGEHRIGVIVDTRDSNTAGQFIVSRDAMAMFAYSENDSAIIASSVNSFGLQAISTNGTALRVDGRIEKLFTEDHYLTLYDDNNNVVASYRYEFH